MSIPRCLLLQVAYLSQLISIFIPGPATKHILDIVSDATRSVGRKEGEENGKSPECSSSAPTVENISTPVHKSVVISKQKEGEEVWCKSLGCQKKRDTHKQQQKWPLC